MLSLERFRFMPMDGEVVFKHFHDDSRHIVWSTERDPDTMGYFVTADIDGNEITRLIMANDIDMTPDDCWFRLMQMQRDLLASVEKVVWASGKVSWRLTSSFPRKGRAWC